MEKRNIIVIGASAGGFEAIKKLVSGLAPDLPAALFIVWHMSADMRGILPDVLNRLGGLQASQAIDGEPIRLGHIYVAPPDHHLLLEEGRIRVTRGPKENRFRPAVDPLFRSAAFAYGPRVTGVILTGALDDGSAGLWTVKQHSGIAIIQDPQEAEVSSMPLNAARAVQVDYSLPVSEISEVLTDIVTWEVPGEADAGNDDIKRSEMEINISKEEDSMEHTIMDFGKLSPYTCPECHGVLTALREGGRTRFRCHTGHAFSVDSLLSMLTENIEESLWSAIRSIRESVLLLNHLGDHLAERNEPRVAAAYFKKAKEAEERADLVRTAVTSHEQLNTGMIEQQVV